MRKIFLFPVLIFFSLLLSSCYQMRMSRGGGQSMNITQTINPADVALPEGYKIEIVAKDLTFPSAVTFDDDGNMYVTEAGYCYGEVRTEPKLLKLEQDGKKTEIAKSKTNGPWTGITYYNKSFYIAEGGEDEGGKILKINMDGSTTTLTENLPSIGDHHTNGPAIKDGYIYFGQGTATNSGIVGPDNKEFGWLPRHKTFHDIPCMDIVLSGKNYISDNVLSNVAGEKAYTGAFVPFNTETKEGQIIKGSIPCNGAIMRIPMGGGKPELVAWGLRNPYGLRFAENGKLYVTENGFDDRGSRPVWGAADVLWEVKEGAWYGWPDYSEGKPISGDEEFKPPGKEEAERVLQKYPSNPPIPIAMFGVHSSSNGFDFSTREEFGFKGEAFVAQFGDMSPKVGKVISPVGFKIVRVNIT